MAIDDAGSSRPSSGETEQLDRVLLGACGVAWLAALGAGVAAVVALADLASGHSVTADASDGGTPWLLYTVIGLSAAVIVGAVPLLLRARRSNLNGDAKPQTARSGRSVFGDPVETSRVRSFGGSAVRRPSVPPPTGRVAFPTAAVDQIWQRCSVAIAAAIGASTAAIGIGTYLAATEHDTSAWFAYGLAAVITLAMPAVPWFFLRQLRSVLA